MALKTLRVLLVIACVLAAWSLGRAQTAVADFELSIDAPAGEVRVKCLRGCQWGALSNEDPPVATFSCVPGPSTVKAAERCGATFNGRGLTAKHAK